MAKLGTVYVEIDGDLSPLNRKLNQLRAKEGRVEIKAVIDRGSFTRAAAAGGALGGEEEVDLRANVDFSSFARARAVQAVLTKESSKLGDVFNRSQLSIGQWTGILAASAPVILDVAGALGALTASLGAATAGLGAMGVGAGGAAVVGIAGIAAVAGPAITSLGELKSAQDAYTEAVERYGKGSTQAETALSKLTFEQRRAGPLATALSENLSTLTRRWRGLTRAGQSDFIGLLNDGVTRLNRKLPLLAQSANKSMGALRGGFSAFLDKATGPEFDHFIEVMTNTFAKSIGPVARGFGNIAKVLQRIAVSVAPDITRWAKGFEGMTQGWVDSTRNAGKLRETLRGLVGHTEAWWDLLVASKDLILAALVPGMGQGKKAIEEMTGQLKEWTNWINAHPKETREFFKEALETTKQLAKTLLSFIPVLFEITKATRPIARVVLGAVQALNSLKIGSVSALTGLIALFLGQKLIRGILGAASALAKVRTALFGVAAASAAANASGLAAGSVGGLGRVTAGGGIAGKAAGAGFAARFASAARFGLIGAGVAGVAAAFTTQGGIIDTIRGKGSVSGEEMAEGLAGQFSESVQPKLNRAFKELNFRALDAMSGAVHKLIDDFEAAGIEIPDNLRKMASATDRQIAKVKEAHGDWRSSMHLLRDMIFRSLGDIKDQTRTALNDINRIQGLSNRRREEMVAKTYHREIQTIREAMKDGLVAHRKGHAEIEKIQRKILRAYGVQDPKMVMVSDAVLAGGARRVGRQRGGLVPGTGVGDKVRATLPVGSGIVNRKAADVLLEPRELAFMPDEVRKIGGPKVIERINQVIPRFAQGGIVALGKSLQRQGYLVGEHPAFGGVDPVHVAGSYHYRGQALDVNWPDVGQEPAKLTSLYNRLKGMGGVIELLWRVANHFDHLHVAMAKGASGALGGIGGPQIRLPRYKASALAGTGHAASLNTIAAIGEMAIREATRSVEGAEGITGSGDVERMFARVAKKLSTSRTATLALGMAGFAESGMRDLPGGMDSSQGALQLLSSTAAGLGISPHDEGAIASAFLLRGFYGRGGANKLAAQGLPAHLVAQSVQGSAFASGSNYAAQAANAKSWMRRFGLREGGMVPYLGAFHRGGYVPRDGFGLLKRGEEVISAQQGGVIDTGSLERVIKRAQRVLVPHPLREARLDRHRRRREEREAEKRRLARLERETRSETRERHRHEQRRERRQERRQERRAEREQAKEEIRTAKEMIRSIDDRNRRLERLEAAENSVTRLLTNLVSSEIGAKGLEKRRLAAAGSVRRY